MLQIVLIAVVTMVLVGCVGSWLRDRHRYVSFLCFLLHISRICTSRCSDTCSSLDKHHYHLGRLQTFSDTGSIVSPYISCQSEGRVFSFVRNQICVCVCVFDLE